MFLQSLMKFHHCLFKILRKQRYGHTFVRSFVRSDNVKTEYPPTNTVCGGYNKLTPLSIFRDLALRKGDSKKFVFYFYVSCRVYTNIPKLFGLVVYYLMDFLGDNVACARFGTNIQ